MIIDLLQQFLDADARQAGFAVGEVPSIWTARTQGRSTNNFWRNFRYVHTALRVLWHGVPVSSLAASPASAPAPALAGLAAKQE